MKKIKILTYSLSLALLNEYLEVIIDYNLKILNEKVGVFFYKVDRKKVNYTVDFLI